MTASAFVDTNVWFYALTDNDPAKQEVARQLIALDVALSVNGQVLRELGSVLFRKTPCDEPELRKLLAEILSACSFVPDKPGQFAHASELRMRYRISYWDSLIVAAALDAGCDTPYTEDMQHGQVIENRLTLANPFAS